MRKSLLIILIFFGCAKEASEPEIPRYTLTVTANPPEGGLVNPQTGTYSAGQSVNIVASANDFYAFKNWTGNWNGSESQFTITMDSNKNINANFDKIDLDEDGVLNEKDNCPNTLIGSDVDGNGCSLGQKDSDNDGYTDDIDLCPYDGGDVDSNGCPDQDNDGVPNNLDTCSSTYGYLENQDPNFVTVDSNGCKINYVLIDTNNNTVFATDEAEIGQLDVIWLPSNTIQHTQSGFTNQNKPFTEKRFKVVDKDEFRSIIINGEDPGFIPVTSKITDMESMFAYAEITPYLREVIQYMDVSNVSNMFNMFKYSYVDNLDYYTNDFVRWRFKWWDTQNVEDMGSMFLGARLGKLELNWDTSNVKNMRSMFAFYHAWDESTYPLSTSSNSSESFIPVELLNCPYSLIEPSNANSKFRDTCLGYNRWGYNEPYIIFENWDVRNVESFAQMFQNYYFVKSGLENWNTSSATEMFSMFSFSRISENLENWDVSNVTDCNAFSQFAELGTGIISYSGLYFKIYANSLDTEITLPPNQGYGEPIKVNDYTSVRLPNFTNCNPN